MVEPLPGDSLRHFSDLALHHSVHALAQIFGVCPLDEHDWVLVAAFSLPVLLLDELLKYISRQRSSSGQFEA